MTALTGKCQQKLLAAIEIPVNDVLQIGPPETALPGETLVIDLKKGLEMVLSAAVISVSYVMANWSKRAWMNVAISSAWAWDMVPRSLQSDAISASGIPVAL